MILVERESADKGKVKNCELLGNLKTNVTFRVTMVNYKLDPRAETRVPKLQKQEHLK